MEIQKREEKKKLIARTDKAIEDIFKTYDRDSSGFLDKKETKAFMIQMLGELGMDATQMTDNEFDQIFHNFDKNHDNVIQKKEIKALVYALTGIDSI